MDFRSTGFWLFWLTFVSMHHNQFNTDGCFGAALHQQQQQQTQQQHQQQLKHSDRTDAKAEGDKEQHVMVTAGFIEDEAARALVSLYKTTSESVFESTSEALEWPQLVAKGKSQKFDSYNNNNKSATINSTVASAVSGGARSPVGQQLLTQIKVKEPTDADVGEPEIPLDDDAGIDTGIARGRGRGGGAGADEGKSFGMLGRRRSSSSTSSSSLSAFSKRYVYGKGHMKHFTSYQRPTATIAATTTSQAPPLPTTASTASTVNNFTYHSLRASIAKLIASESQTPIQYVGPIPPPTPIEVYSDSSTTITDNNGNSNSNGNGNDNGMENTPHVKARHHLTERRHVVVGEKLQYTSEINIKQGRLMGIIRSFHSTTGLGGVDQYLGLPYAEAPVGSRRFMPPGAPLPWSSLKIARHLPPVCPQKLPDVSLKGAAKMSRGRFKHLTRLLPYLKNEHEDCLYLNLYVPREDGLGQTHPYPVIVYIHGESFEWNSGNPYDGSVLASYGQVIVATVNYRLGVMGFMKPSIDENTVANFGLLDQIAALHWIKENIESFGGDKDSVTLMGHSTGAACINYLMISPVASGLFHRAILMSGSAMSDWAASNHSLQLTMQIAHALDCPLNDDDEQMLACLRQKRYQDILKIPTAFSQFSTALGPIVDGHVIPNQPYVVMGQYTEHFGRYDLLFGITESESYHTLGALALDEGLRENERDNLLRFYMQTRFDVRPDLALAATLKKYNDMYNNPVKATNQEHRDVVLDILSDARVVGPLMQTGLFHADTNRRNYMYVFGHNSPAGPHATLPHSAAGDELAFVFGAPLAPAGPFPNNYSAQEKLLAEAVMAYWTNFAKTGNPKAPWKGSFINLHGLEWDRYDLNWPEFNKRTQAYINIGIPPSIDYKYRQIYMNFWNKELPDELNQIAAMQRQPYLHAPHFPTRHGGEVITGHWSEFGTRDNGAEDPVRTLKLMLQEPYGSPAATGGKPSHPSRHMDTAENMYNAPPTFGVARRPEEDIFGFNTLPTNMVSHYGGGFEPTEPVIYGVRRADGAPGVVGNGVSSVNGGTVEDLNPIDADKEAVAKSETTIQLLIGLIVVFIVLNVIIYSTFLLQKKKKKTTTMQRKLGGILSYDGTTDDELKRSKQTANGDGDESYILDVVRKSNTYEAVKTERSPINGFKMTRQLSTSTVDTHTKVCAWMSATGDRQQLQSTLKRLEQISPKTSKRSTSSNFSSLRDSSGMGGSFKTPAPTVNVGVDATPQGRSSSVLEQEPIEVTKLKTADGRNIIICQDVAVEDQELLTPQDSLDNSRYSLMRQHSAATETCDADLPIQHQHSRSDPVDMYYNFGTGTTGDEKVTSFIGKGEELVDINVTSRSDDGDDANAPQRHVALTPEEQLSMIKRRNYPKVLPTDSPLMSADLSMTYKRNSLPPNSFLPHFGKLAPPMPPPRTISTLGRKPSLAGRRNSNNVTTSPLMIAQDCTVEEDEPEITQNTLIVGPIVPKTNCSTLKRKPPTSTPETEATARATSTNDTLSSPRPCLTPLTGPLSGSFQSFESTRQGVQVQPESPNREATHHTEKVYAIGASPTAATPSATAATPLGVIYAQPKKSADRARSGIPRIAPGASPAPDHLIPYGVCNTTTTPTTPASTSRIPQLSRISNDTAAERLHGAEKDKANAAAATTVEAARQPSELRPSDPALLHSAPHNPRTSTLSAASSQSASSSSSSSSSSCFSSAASVCSSAASAGSCSAPSLSSSTSTSSSSSTGTVRTELQQQK